MKKIDYWSKINSCDNLDAAAEIDAALDADPSLDNEEWDEYKSALAFIFRELYREQREVAT